MAIGKYIGVNGVARKITKNYVGVAGIARQEVKEYIGVNGVARLCFQSGIAWLKYECEYINNGSGGWQFVEINSGTQTYENSRTYTVYSDIRVRYDGSVIPEGAVSLTGDSLDGYYDGCALLSGGSSDGEYTEYSFTEYVAEYVEYDSWAWELGSLIGTVTAPEGAYPDADKGYTYDGTFNDGGVTYTRMRDSSGNYYAYVKKG